MPHVLPHSLAATLDGLGSFVFALSGELMAVEKRFDLFGVLVVSFVVAVVGGVNPRSGDRGRASSGDRRAVDVLCLSASAVA